MGSIGDEGNATAMGGRALETDSGWIGAGPDDDLDRRLAAEDDGLDPAVPHVPTLLGPVPSGALGPVLVGERLLVAARGLAAEMGVERRCVLLAELDDAHAAGVGAVVCFADTGADEEELRWLAERAPVHLIAVTAPDSSRAAESGPPRFGVAVVVLDDPASDPASRLREAGRLHVQLGTPILLRAAAPERLGAAVRRLIAAGADPTGIAVGGCDWGDGAAAESLLALGVAVVFDRLVAAGQGPEPRPAPRAEGADGAAETTAAAIARLARAGWADRLLVASGIADGRGLRAGRGPGLGAVLERFPLALMEAGLDAPTVRRILVEAPARYLARVRP